MNEWKDKIRLSLGLIQQRNGNNRILEFLTDSILNLFMISLKESDGSMWTRNSHVFNAHIPLLSDLDLTLIDATTETALKLHHLRRKFLLVGEINFYHPEIIQDIIHLANPYELMRDPELLHRLNLNPTRNEPALIAFFARQIQSDQKWLQSFPEVRQQKWRYLCQLMGFKPLPIPSNRQLISFLKDDEIKNDLWDFLHLPMPKEEILDMAQQSEWNYLFPNFYIWKNSDSENDYLKRLSPLKRNVLMEQIKWEFWGIGCHFYWLRNDVSINHLERLLEVYKKLDPKPDDLHSMNRIIDFIRRQ